MEETMRFSLQDRELLQVLRKLPSGEDLKRSLAAMPTPKLFEFVARLDFLKFHLTVELRDSTHPFIQKSVLDRMEICKRHLQNRNLYNQFCHHMQKISRDVRRAHG